MDSSSNNDHRVYNQLIPLESSNAVNAIYTQINQLNYQFTNYQISNNKKIESISQKIDFQFNAINEKLSSLSKEVNDLSREISMSTKNNTLRNDDKLSNIFNKHIQKLSNDLQELSSSLYTGSNYPNQILGPKDTLLVGRDSMQNVIDEPKNYNNYRHATSPKITIIDTEIDNRNRSWSKSLSLRSPAPQPNSAPSSPFTNRYFDFPTTLERNSTIRNDINHESNQNGIGIMENSHSELQLEDVQHINGNARKNSSKKLKINNQESGPTGSQLYIYPLSNPRQHNSFHVMKEPFHSAVKRPIAESNRESLIADIETQNVKVPEYNDFGRHNPVGGPHRTSIMSNQSRTLQIGPEMDITSNSFGQVPNVITRQGDSLELNAIQETRNPTVYNSTKQAKVIIPGVTRLKGKKPSTTPQYKLEKSLRNVFEIWKEYEYGINGKPPLRELEAQYNTKWRNETELRTFLRRKKIYDAIEKGKKAGYTERQIIEELETLRTYEKYGVMKKKPLLWLYSNIPDKFS